MSIELLVNLVVNVNVQKGSNPKKEMKFVKSVSLTKVLVLKSVHKILLWTKKPSPV
jgi:hypothetical protein